MHHADRTDSSIPDGLDLRLEDALRYAIAIGVVLVLLLPAARGFSETLGWLPLWLLAMPAVALWALRGFPLPRRATPGALAMPARRRRTSPQARRRSRRMMGLRVARAA